MSVQAAETGTVVSDWQGRSVALRIGVKGGVDMAFSVTKTGPLRGLGLYRRSGKHAAPRGVIPAPRQSPEQRDKEPYKAMHAASMPRLSGPEESLSGPDEQKVA